MFISIKLQLCFIRKYSLDNIGRVSSSRPDRVSAFRTTYRVSWTKVLSHGAQEGPRVNGIPFDAFVNINIP